MFIYIYLLQPSLNKTGRKAEAGLSNHAGMEARSGIPDMQCSPESVSSQQGVINLQIHLWKTGLIPNTLSDTLQNPGGFCVSWSFCFL